MSFIDHSFLEKFYSHYFNHQQLVVKIVVLLKLHAFARANYHCNNAMSDFSSNKKDVIQY